MFGKISLLVVTLLAGLTAEGYACETVRTYRVPTNFELVEQADLIVLARVLPSEPPRAKEKPRIAWSETPRITLSPEAILKGTLPAQPLMVSGTTHWHFSKQPVVPLPTPLGRPHPSSNEGSCTRTAYPVGGLIVAMFKNGPKGSVQLDHPFARQIEDVEGPDAVWVRAVKLYVELSKIPAGPRRAKAVLRKARRLEGNFSDPGGQQIGLDLKIYLSQTHQLNYRLGPPERQLFEIWSKEVLGPDD